MGHSPKQNSLSLSVSTMSVYPIFESTSVTAIGTWMHTSEYFIHYYLRTIPSLLSFRLGLNIRQAAYAVKKYKSHRRVDRRILMDINVINRGRNG
jgi:hypothetical protein